MVNRERCGDGRASISSSMAAPCTPPHSDAVEKETVTTRMMTNQAAGAPLSLAFLPSENQILLSIFEILRNFLEATAFQLGWAYPTVDEVLLSFFLLRFFVGGPALLVK